MSQSSPLKFSKWRTIFWPVHRYELKKLLPMLAIFFLISFNYNILRTVKDPLIITAPHSGAEVIPFIKVWVMLPTAVLLTYIFTRISQVLSREHTFYVMNAIFISYFLFFILFLYPYKDQLEPERFCAWLTLYLPNGYHGMVAMIRYWTYTSFYVMAELWGTAIMMVAFWGFANEVTKVDEAKRFYGLFGVGANLSGSAAGPITIMLSKRDYNPSLPFGYNSWDQSLTLIILTVLLASFISLALFRWLNCRIFIDPSYASIHEIKEQRQDKKKSSFRKDLQYVLQSPYMLAIATIVLAFGFVINTTEVLWKHEVRMLFPQAREYSIYMGQIMTWISILATITAFLFTGNLIRWAGWTFSALITPVVLFVTSIGFFGFLLFPQAALWANQFGWSALEIAVFFGTLQNALSRTAKYTVFDATKELAFIPLDRHTKLKGKAAIDGMVSRLGKSGASILYTIMLTQVSSLTACAPVIAVCLFIAIGLWVRSVLQVGKEFELLENSRSKAAENIS
jgi:AAA family ATP:ADP antiporter